VFSFRDTAIGGRSPRWGDATGRPRQAAGQAISLGTRSTPERPWTKGPTAAGMGER
jgi:hypothetical protein